MKLRALRFITAALLPLSPALCAATDSPVSISGFGTAGVSCFSSSTADYAFNVLPWGPGRSKGCDAGLDSNLGVQMDVKLSPALELGLQAVSERRPDRSFTPDPTVAQLRWHPDEAWTVRLGRAPFASFLYSESRQVRYAMPWVRPPVEVYGLAPVFSFDGIEVLHRRDIASWHAELHAGLGTTRVTSPANNSTEVILRSIGIPPPPSNTRQISHLRANYGFFNATLQRATTQFKLGYTAGRVKADYGAFESFLATLRTLPDGNAVADDLDVNKKLIHLVTAGMRHENGDWLLMSEMSASFSTSSALRKQFGAYVTLGRSVGAWTPYATLARRWTRGPEGDSRAGFLEPTLIALYRGQHTDDTSLSLGMAWAAQPRLTVKAQMDWIRPDHNSLGPYRNFGPDYNLAQPGTGRLFTLNFDFLF
ncbi:MAG: hypothetical protein KF778_17405 [Rhodocyclaceae bacterium]|nr:hypothetical protein [Rhodocyclaceae bacterium]MBX3670180.1 hypothetical protein [Rhodocyclaceae bacterium]